MTVAREGESLPAFVDRLVGTEGLPVETGDAILEFGEFLRWSAGFEHQPGDPIPPNIMRRFRSLLGLTHREIDRYETRLWRAEVARPETEAGR